MAVEKKFAVDEQDTTYPQSNYKREGQVLNTVLSKVAIAEADDDGSVYGCAVVPGNAVIKNILVACTAITGGTDYDIGLYRLNPDQTIGDAIDADMFLDGQTLAVAKARGSELTGMSALSVANSDKTVAQLAAAASSKLEKDPQYVIALTGNTVGTAAGTALLIIEYISNV